MIDSAMMAEIQKRVQIFWSKEVRKAEFIQIAQGKEIGHRIADLVDDKTTGWLAVNYTARYQRNKRGDKVPRSMGDIWLEHRGIFHPINVKTSVASTNGQPNMVSLKKLLNALVLRQIDTYYLLVVKLEISEATNCNVHFVDMLDYLDYVTFDSGPGQIMLKARTFFQAMANHVTPPKKTMRQKIDQLLDMLEDGEKRLARNRKRALDLYRKKVIAYAVLGDHVVTPDSQAPLNLR